MRAADVRRAARRRRSGPRPEARRLASQPHNHRIEGDPTGRLRRFGGERINQEVMPGLNRTYGHSRLRPRENSSQPIRRGLIPAAQYAAAFAYRFSEQRGDLLDLSGWRLSRRPRRRAPRPRGGPDQPKREEARCTCTSFGSRHGRRRPSPGPQRWSRSIRAGRRDSRRLACASGSAHGLPPDRHDDAPPPGAPGGGASPATDSSPSANRTGAQVRFSAGEGSGAITHICPRGDT